MMQAINTIKGFRHICTEWVKMCQNKRLTGNKPYSICRNSCMMFVLNSES
jgi:hypothetical protein